MSVNMIAASLRVSACSIVTPFFVSFSYSARARLVKRHRSECRGRLLGRDSDESCQLRQFPPGSQKLLAWNGNGSSGKSWIVNQYGVFLNRYHYQGVQTLRLPVVQRRRGDEDERWNPFLQPSNKIVKRRANHFGMTSSDTLREEQYVQYRRAYLLSFQKITKFFFPQSDALERQDHPYCGGDTGVVALGIRLWQMRNL